jgi:hypothetical protein
MSAAGPTQGANCSLSEGRREAPRERMSAAGPTQGANCSLSEGRREAPRERY